MPISNIRGQDLLGQAFLDFMAKTGQGASEGYAQAKDSEQFNEAFGTIKHRYNQVGQQPLTMENLGALGSLLGTRQGPPTIDLLKLLQPETPEPFTLGAGSVRFDANGNPIASAPFKPEEAPHGQPTTLAKLHSELAAMAPDDPRIPSWKARIRREEIGVPNYQLKQDSQGQYISFDPKTGGLGAGKDVYAPTPSEVRSQVASLDDNLKSIQKVKSIFQKGDTGPVKGRIKKLGVKFFNDAEAQELINTAAQLRTIIYGLSGKQINEAELNWLNNEILPTITQPDENFEATMNTFEAWVKQRRDSIVGQFPGVGHPTGATGITPEQIDAMTEEELDAYLEGQ